MLHQDVRMTDIDVDQWRHAQELLLRSAKACRRLVVIHEHGRVVKFRHSDGDDVRGRVAVVDGPRRVARELYEANRDAVDFVVVMERHAVDDYFARVQDAWSIDDDIDTYVQRTYAALDGYADGIVTHPSPARETLGLQWRLGASHDRVRSAVRAFVAPESTVVVGVESRGTLWSSLVLDFDADHEITLVTTADPSTMDIRGTAGELAERLAADQEAGGRTVSLCMVLDHAAAVDFVATPADDKADMLRRLLSDGRASLARATPALAAYHVG
jgi:hypothetical protein